MFDDLKTITPSSQMSEGLYVNPIKESDINFILVHFQLSGII